jgi:hypothetical protein
MARKIKIAEDVAHDVMQHVTQGVSGVAENGNVKVLIFSIAIFQR